MELPLEYKFNGVQWNMVNLFPVDVPHLYPLKTSENRRFSDVFRGYRSRTLVENGFMLMQRGLVMINEAKYSRSDQVKFVEDSL